MKFKLKEWTTPKNRNHKVLITREDILKMYRQLKEDLEINGFLFPLERIKE